MTLRKKITLGVIAALIIGGGGYSLFGRKDSAGNIQTDTVKRQDLRSTVLTTGQVVSGIDLNLSFKSGGVVKKISVKEGEKVASGQILAVLDQTDALANLTSARGAAAQAKANYDKVLAGASSEAVAVAAKAVDAAKVTLENANTNLANIEAQQDITVHNAYTALLNTSFSALAGSTNQDAVVPAITGTYSGTTEGTYQISLFNSGNGLRFQTSGLEIVSGDVRSTPVVFGSKGLYISFATTPSVIDTWTVAIPNIYASAYTANNNAYQAALNARDNAVSTAKASVKSAQSALDQANASLDVQRAQARPADIAVAKAQILTAQGQVETAQAAVENTTLRAPAEGTITQVDIKVGEQASALKQVMILQDIGDLHAEANVSEASIATVRSGQEVDFTFDALGPDRHFSGTVFSVNPASIVISGVVNYKVIATFEPIAEIKPGMTTNMTIRTANKDKVIAIPQRAVINKEQKKLVRIVTDAKKKTYREAEVVTGLEADGGLIEIVSGLSEGQEIVTFIKP